MITLWLMKFGFLRISLGLFLFRAIEYVCVCKGVSQDCSRHRRLSAVIRTSQPCADKEVLELPVQTLKQRLQARRGFARNLHARHVVHTVLNLAQDLHHVVRGRQRVRAFREQWRRCVASGGHDCHVREHEEFGEESDVQLDDVECHGAALRWTASRGTGGTL